MREVDKARRASILILQELIEAYQKITERCLSEADRLCPSEISDQLYLTANQCETTIESLQELLCFIKMKSDFSDIDFETSPKLTNLQRHSGD